jgi:hypothetical protein
MTDNATNTTIIEGVSQVPLGVRPAIMHDII